MNTMKKLFAALLALTMVLSLTACAGGDNGTTDDAADTGATELLETVWNAHGEDEKFSVWGGSYESQVENAPGAMDTADAATVEQLVVLPQDQIGKVDQVASLFHMMNANTFTAAAFHLTDRESAADVAAALESAVQSKHWMCGFPELLVVYSVNGCVVSAFGNTDLVSTFRDHLTAQYPDAVMLYDEAVQP